ncbi:hypothetical protein [uncultured Ferrimonas sp.]|uniref:hypothetical protein n=1 Tax=uncultured Ferrimonas sp. TaxID=432640 RepID=UPI00261F83CE|nr:hypothetical protein [uncultured Ferrimonas sp.]
MSLARTLICTHGHDSGVRVVAIQAAIVVALLLLSGLFYNTPMQFSAPALLAVVAAPLSWLSGQRRLRQAGRPLGLAWLLALAWLLFALAQVAVGGGALLALILPVAMTTVLALLPSKGAAQASQWGYSGPALQGQAQLAGMRVEPSLNGESRAVPEQHHWDEHSTSPATDWAAVATTLQTRLRQQWKPLLAAAAVGIVGVTAIAFWPSAEPTPAVAEHPSDAAATTATAPAFKAQVTLPDSFQLALADDTLLISWPGDPAQQGELWSLLSARGDRSCAAADFNNGDSFRPVKVEVWPNDIYYAYFSPLDAADIVFDVAMRGSFTLCGYNFSLRGSMKPLQAHPAFALYTRK